MVAHSWTVMAVAVISIEFVCHGLGCMGVTVGDGGFNVGILSGDSSVGEVDDDQ